MRVCPTCQRTYPDDAEFCLKDLTPLPPPPAVTEAALASSLARRFRIVRKLGAGGMGSVFLAEQIILGNRPVALKVLSRKWLDDPEFLSRFHNEGISTARIQHPNVVTIYETGQADDGSPYIAMEYLEGEPLSEALRSRGALPLGECAEILHQAARGLNAAHKLAIIHRDLKPENLFLTRGDEGELIVKVVDFGIAKLRESPHTQTGMLWGTPAYMSFEQASGMRSDELDARSDIYSLGVVVYQMVAGRVPFTSDTQIGYLRKHLMELPPPFRAVAPGLAIPAEVEAVVMNALAKDRNARYGSVLEFARAFAEAAKPTPAAVGAVREPPLRDAGSTLPPTVVHPAPAAPPPNVGAVREPPLHPPGAPVPPAAPTTPPPDVGARRRLAPTEAGPGPAPKKTSHAAIAGVVAAAAVVIVAALAWVYWPRPAQPPKFAQEGTGVPAKPQTAVTAPAARSVRDNPKDGLKYVWIPPGTFMMGCSPGDNECRHDEKPAHQVTITRGFWIGQTPVTVGAYKRFAQASGRSMPPEANLPGRALNPGWGDEAMPIVNVSWDDAQAYCSWAGGRLLREAEWEYAARGGSPAARYGALDEVAWYADNSGQGRLDSTAIWNRESNNYAQRLNDNGNGMHEVGQKRPNAFGLFDVLGNVWQWVNDWYDDKYYQNSPSQDPPGPTSGQYRVLRGGSWVILPRLVRVSIRYRLNPDVRNLNFGLRCGRGAEQPPPAAPVEAPRRAVPAPVPLSVRENPKDGLKYVWIPPGTFAMGCSPSDSECSDEEKPAHQVTITRGFWIGQTPVTVGAYKRFAEATGRQMPDAPNFNNGWTNENMPIVNVTWNDAQAYCGWMGGRLPTEAEWEYAARGGNTEGRYGPLDEVAWYSNNSGGQTHDVAQKRPNGFGLYDMLGNVWQWVNDWRDPNYYQSSPSQDPRGPTSGQYRVLRGGSWGFNPWLVRVSYRLSYFPVDRSDDVGLRCGREVGNP